MRMRLAERRLGASWTTGLELLTWQNRAEVAYGFCSARNSGAKATAMRIMWVSVLEPDGTCCVG